MSPAAGLTGPAAGRGFTAGRARGRGLVPLETSPPASTGISGSSGLMTRGAGAAPWSSGGLGSASTRLEGLLVLVARWVVLHCSVVSLPLGEGKICKGYLFTCPRVVLSKRTVPSNPCY